MKSSILLVLVAVVVRVYATDFEQRSSNWTVGQTVQTSSGPVSGQAATNDSQVSQYLGIPFAQAPIGNLRFAAPVQFNGTAPLNGSSFGPSCPVELGSSALPTLAEIQAANVTTAGIELDELTSTPDLYSEDCLYLNVWTKPQTGEAKKAVLVWIYGGGFNSGSSSVPTSNGANIAEQEDVVVVSFNYRLSILGFPGNPAGANNLGLLDQRLAVEWVRDNIENFGGDPSRITLFGQSAGAASIDLYSYAWKSDPIAAGFISESGNVFSWGLPNPNATSVAAWFNVTETLGCGTSSSNAETVLDCMRTKNYTDILNAVPVISGPKGILGLFLPTVDGTVVFANYSQETPAKIPYLIGNNNYEAGLFRTSLATHGLLYSDTFWTDFDLQEFTCPCGIRANASVSAGNPTWRYRYFGVFPDTEISSEAGAYHGSEISVIFDTVPSSPAATEAEISIANYIRAAWATFAKNPQTGLTTYGWPTYNTSQDTLVRLAYDNVTGPNLINPYAYDADCVFVNVSSTNLSYYPVLPNLGASVTPTGTASSTSSTSATASATASASASAALTKSAGKRMEVRVTVVVGLGALFAAYLI